ncbi:MAG TPA: hypothetical protein VN843_33450, partial [Anaerolineales bacterium]|nr:hypothetical protein [Anaerolineales bacterium]
MKQKTPYRIYFAWSTTSFKGSLEPTIVFTPTSDRWNDFTHRTVFKCHILNAKHLRRFSTEVHLAFLDTKDTAVDCVRIKLKGLSRLESTDLPFFYTMLPSLDSYRRVVA